MSYHQVYLIKAMLWICLIWVYLIFCIFIIPEYVWQETAVTGPCVLSMIYMTTLLMWHSNHVTSIIHIICNSAITSAPGHEHSNGGLWYGRMTRFTRIDLELTFVWHICLPFTDISNILRCNCTSGKDVDILATDTLNRGSGMVGHINPV